MTSRLQLDIEERLRFETVIADLSSSFINLPASAVDSAIESAQQRVCDLLGIDLSALWEWDEREPGMLTITHLYSAGGRIARPVDIDARNAFPWLLQRCLRGEANVVHTEQLPPEAALDRDARRAFGITSSVVIPLSVGGGPMVGVLSFNVVDREVEWPDTIVERLKLVAQVFANALERRRTDQLLRQSEDRLTMAAESSGSGLWILDLATRTYWVTAKTREIFGYRPDEEITLSRFLRSVHPDDRQRIEGTVDYLVRSTADTSVEYRIVRPDGAVSWVVSRAKHRTVPGRRDTIMGVTVDVTDARLAEDRWRLTIEATPNSMIVVDANGVITLCNQATERLFGYSRDDLIGKTIEMLVPEDLRERHQILRDEYDAHPRKLRSGRELVGRTKDGRHIVLDVELTPMATPAGRLVLASVVDITARREAEIEAGRTRAAIGYLSRAAMLGELAGVLAHEMNQPLGAILCNAQAAHRMVADGRGDRSEILSILEDIIADDQRTADVIDRLRVLLRQRDTQFVPVSVNEVVQDVLRLVRFDVLIRDIRVEAELAADRPFINGDRVRLQQALLNLVVNASDAMTYANPADQRLVIRTQRTDDGYVRISVVDHGSGIHPAVQARLYDSFFTTKAAAFGLGLPISRIIVAAHGGVLGFENNPAGGAIFHMTFREVAAPENPSRKTPDDMPAR